MKPIWSILGPICVAAALVAGASEPPKDAAVPAAPAGTPRLEVETFSVDLGEIAKGKEAEAVFVLRNKGDGVLRILSAKPT